MKTVLSLFLLTLLISCGGGGTIGGESKSHKSLAKKFRQELKKEGKSITLAKSSTRKKNYAVYFDKEQKDYFAIDISKFDPGKESALKYYKSKKKYRNLQYIPGKYKYDYNPTTNTFDKTYISSGYRSPGGVWFEKTDATVRDLEKLSALKEAESLNSITNYLTSNHGLSSGRSKEIARITVAWDKAGKNSLTDEENDYFAKEIFGFSISEGLKAYEKALEGNSADLDDKLEIASEKNNISVEHLESVLEFVINQ